jgi:hypothetical protein
MSRFKISLSYKGCARAHTHTHMHTHTKSMAYSFSVFLKMSQSVSCTCSHNVLAVADVLNSGDTLSGGSVGKHHLAIGVTNAPQVGNDLSVLLVKNLHLVVGLHTHVYISVRIPITIHINYTPTNHTWERVHRAEFLQKHRRSYIARQDT